MSEDFQGYNKSAMKQGEVRLESATNFDFFGDFILTIVSSHSIEVLSGG